MRGVYASRMIRFASAVFSCTLVAAFVAPAFADAQSDLDRAIATTEATKSYHMAMSSSAMSFQGDFVAPSAVHMTMRGMETINVNGKMYMRRGSGAWQSIPGAGFTDSDMLQMFKTHRADFRAKDVGMKLVDGRSLHAYNVQNLKTGHPETVYLDGSGRIVRVDAPKMTMRFSNFGESVRIAAPM